MHVYSFSLIDAAGAAAANRFLSMFNPANSGKTLQLLRLVVVSYSVAVSLTKNSIRATRITAASGGTLQLAAAINKFRPGTPDPIAQVRTANPTVTLAAEIDGFPTNQNLSAIGTMAVSRQVGDYLGLPVALLCYEGGGVALHQTVAGDVDQTYVITPVWGEF